MSKTISFGLSVSELDKAIKEVEQYKVEFNDKLRLFAERLAQEGVFIAKTRIMSYDAIDTGELEASIQSEVQWNVADGIATTTIFTDCPYAPYICFGFGIVGAQNPHPDPTIKNWKYDEKGHGESGWMYTKDKGDTYHWSKGQPSKPFMWETSMELRTKIATIAKEVFKS